MECLHSSEASACYTLTLAHLSMMYLRDVGGVSKGRGVGGPLGGGGGGTATGSA